MEAENTVQVIVARQAVRVVAGETLLSACEREGVAVASSCRAGVCQSCLMRATTGKPPAKAQAGLKAVHKEQGYFLACLCHPDEAFACEAGDVDPFRGEASVEAVTAIGPDVVEVRFRRPAGFDFHAGQFVSFRWPDGVARSYSIASLPSDPDAFTIHVRRIPGGLKSAWFHEEAEAGDVLGIQGPRGDCFYAAPGPERPLLLIGAGTGIAPLHAIARDALAQGHEGPIQVVQAGLTADRLYHVAQWRALSEAHANVRYLRCVKEGEDGADLRVGDVATVARELAAAMTAPIVYLCGDPKLVNDLRKRLFLAGISLKDIHADAFVGTA